MVDRWVGGGDTSRRQAGSPIVEIYQMRKAETLFLEGARDKGRNSIGWNRSKLLQWLRVRWNGLVAAAPKYGPAGAKPLRHLWKWRCPAMPRAAVLLVVPRGSRQRRGMVSEMVCSFMYYSCNVITYLWYIILPDRPGYTDIAVIKLF